MLSYGARGTPTPTLTLTLALALALTLTLTLDLTLTLTLTLARYASVVAAILQRGVVSAQQRQQLQHFRDIHRLTQAEHEEELRRNGWSAAQFEAREKTLTLPLPLPLIPTLTPTLTPTPTPTLTLTLHPTPNPSPRAGAAARGTLRPLSGGPGRAHARGHSPPRRHGRLR